MSLIQKAVFPLAGHGTRFLPMTKSSPKEMLPIVDKPVVQCVLEEAVASGINQIVMVTGRGKRAIEDHFDISYELEDVLRKGNKNQALEELRRITMMSEIVYLRQKEALGLGHAVLCTKNVIGNEPFVVALGDEILDGPEPALAQLMRAHEEVGGPVIGVQSVPMSAVHLYGIIAGKEVRPGLFRVEWLSEKPSLADAPSDMAIIGRYLLTPDVFPVLEHQKAGVGGEIQLTDALNTLAHRRPLHAVVVMGERFDTGDKLGFLKATVRFALKRPDLGPFFQSFLEDLVSQFPEVSEADCSSRTGKHDYAKR
ncbi:MAG: UTP--glucose-1-phosphate uridylyltransferase GalU [Leptospirales bacterium]